jgi:phage replication O-like protein O
MKILPPNYFQCPNDLVDYWMPLLKEAELKILLIIIRKTFGWHKIKDRISLSQMEMISGLTRSNVCKAITELINKGIILKEIEGVLGTEKVYYSLIIQEQNTGIVPIPPQYCSDTPPSILKIPTKETNTKETNTKETAAEEAAVAAAVSFKSEKKEKQVYDCLLEIGIPIADQIEITQNSANTEEMVACVVKWAIHPNTKISKTLQQAIKWGLRQSPLPDIPKLPEDEKQQNRAIAERIKPCLELQSGCQFEVLSKCVEISHGQMVLEISYGEKGFKDKLKLAMEKFKIKIRK